jgi:hypothetical protein
LLLLLIKLERIEDMKKRNIPVVVGAVSLKSDLWFGDIAVADERQRLRQNVINAALFWRKDWLTNSQPLRDAVDALDAFETELKVRRAESGQQSAEILTRGY